MFFQCVFFTLQLLSKVLKIKLVFEYNSVVRNSVSLAHQENLKDPFSSNESEEMIVSVGPFGILGNSSSNS